MNTIDLGALPTEPISDVIDRMARDHFKGEGHPVNFATTAQQMQHIHGYMAGKSKMPHVAVEFYPNVFIARVEFQNANPDIDGDEMHFAAKCVEIRVDGFSFFRFVRTVK